MIDYHKTLVNALNSVLPTHYEMTLTSQTKTPCISYMELDNSDTDTGDTLGYSRIQYQVKVWGTKIETVQKYALLLHRISEITSTESPASVAQLVRAHDC